MVTVVPDRLKICLVSDFLPEHHTTWSGQELVCMRLADMLREAGHEVLFLTTPFEKGSPAGNQFPVSSPLNRLGMISRNLPIDWVTASRAKRVLREQRPHVVHFHAKNLFLPVLDAASSLRIPTVFTVVDHFLKCPNTHLYKPDGKICDEFHGAQCAGCVPAARLPSMLRMGPNWGLARLLRYRARTFEAAIRKLSLIIALSETSRRRMEQAGASSEKLRVCYHFRIGVDGVADREAPFPEPSVLFVGWLSELKGLHVVVEAMRHVVDEAPEAKLRVIGVGQEGYTEGLRRRIQELGLAGNIEFLGKQPNESVLSLIGRSNVVVVPEQWPNDYGPVILLEAKAMGKPVVASRIGATPEFLKDGEEGFLVERDNPEQFASKIGWLLRHQERAHSMGAQGRESVRHFYDGGPLGQHIVKLYRSLVSSTPT